MTLLIDSGSRELAATLADVAEVFSNAVNEDGLHTLLLACLEVSGISAGTALLIGSASLVDMSVSLDTEHQQSVVDKNVDVPYLANRAMHSLQPEFSITSNHHRTVSEYAFPLRVHGQPLGAVVLHSNENTPLDEHAIAILQSIADLAAFTIDQTNQILQSRTLVAQLQTALDSRVLLEQAKGILAERMHVDFPTAFQTIRVAARKEQRPIHHVAADIIAGLPIT
ncbi:MAG: hypothetical protein RJA15_863 [Actinomycetota bacterium]|jgi:GAF domain-containing protein